MRLFLAVCVWLVPACVQADIGNFTPQRNISATAEHAGQIESRSETPALLDDWNIDRSAGLDAPSRNFARAWQESRMSNSELFASGGVQTFGPDGVSDAMSQMSAVFEVFRPARIHLTGEITVEANPNLSVWNGGALIDISPRVANLTANTVGDERIELLPIGAFVVGQDGMARATIDKQMMLQPGAYEFRAYATSYCVHPRLVPCEGRPIEYSARLLVAPEPSALALLLLIPLAHLIRLLKARRSG